MDIIIHGFILALGLILPLGVQNIFIFTQGATQPTFIRALPASISASICDTILIVLSISGLSYIIVQMDWLRTILMIGGSLFLLYMSVVIWRTSPTNQIKGEALSTKKQILFACSVSFLNPSALIDIIGVIGTSSLQYEGIDVVVFAISCISVSWIWFFFLAVAGAHMKKIKNQEKVMTFFNKCAALFIFSMALYIAFNLFK